MEEVKYNYTFENVAETEEGKSLREQYELRLLALCRQARGIFKEYLEKIGEDVDSMRLSLSVSSDFVSVSSIKDLDDLDSVYLIAAHDWEREGFGFSQEVLKKCHKEVVG